MVSLPKVRRVVPSHIPGSLLTTLDLATRYRTSYTSYGISTLPTSKKAWMSPSCKIDVLILSVDFRAMVGGPKHAGGICQEAFCKLPSSKILTVIDISDVLTRDATITYDRLRVSSPLKSFIRAHKEQPDERIHQQGLTRRDVKELGVKINWILHEAPVPATQGALYVA